MKWFYDFIEMNFKAFYHIEMDSIELNIVQDQ